MLKFLSLLSVVALVAARDCDRDCNCQDSLLDECKFPPTPQTAVHVDTLDECKATCDVFASFNQCDFFFFNANNDIDENCKIYAGETVEEFVNSCDIVGQPVSTSADACYPPLGSDTCSPVCSVCANCSKEKCARFFESGCDNIGGGQQQESNDIPTQENCIAFCNTLMSAGDVTFAVFHRESTRCECYSSGSRSCKSYIVAADIVEPSDCIISG